MRPNNTQIVKGTIVANVTGPVAVVWINGAVRASWQIVTSGTGIVNGVYKLQVSNDKPVGAFPENFIPTNWNDVASATATVNVSTPTAFMIPFQELSYEYARIFFTDSSSGAATGSTLIDMKSIAF